MFAYPVLLIVHDTVYEVDGSGKVILGLTTVASDIVAVGDTVKAGDPLCLIEAMKMFNKIEAECGGVISARLIENEQPVEYDQPLFIIEPHE